MIATTFNGNPRKTIISYYSPTNVSEETELVAFYDELSTYRNTSYKSLAEIWMPKSGKTETTDTGFTTPQIRMDNI